MRIVENAYSKRRVGPGTATRGRARRRDDLLPAVEHLAATPRFAEHLRRFRETGSGVTLTEVPAVLDTLLDLRSNELMQIVRLLGLKYSQLQMQGRVKRGPATAAEVLRILSGEITGTGPKLPTSTAQVISRLKAIDRARLTSSGPDLIRLEQERTLLCDIGRKLLELKDLPWTSKLGIQVSGNLNLRLAKPLTGDKRVGGLVDLENTRLPEPLKQVINFARPAFTVQRGVIVGQKRRRARRHIETWTSTSFGSAVGGVNHAFKEDGRMWGASIQFPCVSVSQNPVRGRGISVGLPLLGGVNLSERFIGVAVFPHVLTGGPLAGGVGFFGMRLLPSVDIGLTGDALQHVTQPVANFLEELIHPAARRATTGGGGRN